MNKQEEWNELEWIANLKYIIGDLSETQWKALFILIEQKIRNRGSKNRDTLVERVKVIYQPLIKL